MSLSLEPYDFHLPSALIAKHPPKKRDGGLLMQVGETNSIMPIVALPSLLRTGDLLVLNDSRVLPARLCAQKESGGRVEILLERLLSKSECWAQIGSNRSPLIGSRLQTVMGDLIVIAREGLFYLLRIDKDKTQNKNIKSWFLNAGKIPLPPYLGREADATDESRYQTVFARYDGSVAAPTAGLHFTPTLLSALKNKGIRLAYITLHIGGGTFLPIRTSVENHIMHAENYFISARTARMVAAARKRKGRIFAVGTTALRALESALAEGQSLQTGVQETNLFIQPGFQFQLVDGLFTNFHLPRSTLYLLVCALGGKRVMQAYQQAIEKKMRFYSYGDMMFILKENTV